MNGATRDNQALRTHPATPAKAGSRAMPFDPRLVRTVLGAFRRATGLETSLIPPGTAVPWSPGRCALCRWLNRFPAARAACQEAHERLQLKAQAGPDSCKVQCFAGLTELAVPVAFAGKPLGTLRCGQVFSKRPTKQDLKRRLQTLGRYGVGVDRKRLRELYVRTAIVSDDRIRAATLLLEILAKHLAEAAGRQASAVRSHAPAAIERAQKFLVEHLGENIRTRQAAARACLSLQHFCRQFKAATGFTFTEYAARARVEKARKLLLETQLRISDVAYECGFRSIPHFDRVFKRLTGESPTDWRESLGRCNSGAQSQPRLNRLKQLNS